MAQSENTSSRLRIGVMLDDLRVTNWVYRILSEIQSSGFATLELVILRKQQASSRQTLTARIKEFHQRGLWNRYADWDYRRNRCQTDAFALRDVTDLIAQDKILTVETISKKFTDRFQDADIARIKEARLDVLLRFGFRIIKGEILECARFGVWSYHHGDNREYRGGPALFWEVYERNPVSGTILQVLSEKLDAGKVLYRSWGRTDFDSVYLNRNENYWKTSAFVLRRLRELHLYGWDHLTASADYHEKDSYTKGIYRAPNNLAMARFLARRVGSALRSRARGLLFAPRDHQWFIAYRRRDSGPWLWLRPPRDRFYADPFLLAEAGRHYLFFEDFRFGAERGLISFVEILPDGKTTAPAVIFDQDIHLSYPFVFKHDTQIYMVPETKERRRIELYRATDFPEKWKLEKVLLDGVEAVDATLHFYAGRWWLFCNIAEYGASTHDELHLFYSDQLTGPFTPHPKNPVVSDVRRSRPAGRLFMREGHLMRPAQDCSISYGHAITLHRVETMNERDYCEVPVDRIDPSWHPGNLGTHTIDDDGAWETRDGKLPYRAWRWNYGK